MFFTLLSWIFCMSPMQAPVHIAQAHHNKISTIIFDIDGLLCTTDKSKFMQKIGIGTIMHYILGSRSFPTNDAVLAVLEKYPYPAINAYAYHHNKPLSNLMLAWQTGTAIDPEQMKQWIENNDTISSHQKDFFKNTFNTMFNPKEFISTRALIPGGIALARHLKAAGYKVCILSNWDLQSFPLLQEAFPELFTNEQGLPLFDGIYTSGQLSKEYQTPLLKPMKQIYEIVADKQQVLPSACLFIDDEPLNLEQAHHLGMHTVRAWPKHMHKTATHVKEILQIHAHRA